MLLGAKVGGEDGREGRELLFLSLVRLSVLELGVHVVKISLVKGGKPKLTLHDAPGPLGLASLRLGLLEALDALGLGEATFPDALRHSQLGVDRLDFILLVSSKSFAGEGLCAFGLILLAEETVKTLGGLLQCFY